ncbi:MAG: hypothetical protein HON90_14750, partial [Halobacteriovoraceae bacterium]|nr:hypothetical protein [Halobacteriovoraceae bacterium]
MKNAILGLTLLTSLTSLAGECNLYDNHLSSMINTELRETRFSSGSQIKIFPENLDFGERNSLKAIENRGYRLVKLKTDASVEMVLPYYGECYAYHAESFGYNDSCKNAKWNLSIIDLK